MTGCITSPNTRPNATNGSGSGSDATSSAFRIRVIWDYLKMDVSDVPPTPLEAQQAKRKLVDKLLERELQVKKQPVRRKEPEEVKKEPVEQE